ncbi:MAG: J domain-containing protein [Chitinophagaceae bacterium]|nr:J domain-containing protein [Chitinophagaceae bacterium]
MLNYLRPVLEIKDYYNILDIPPSATLKEIKAAYRRLAHQYHPDKSGNDLYAAAQFEVIKEAYEVLSNPSKKEYYLQQRWYNQSIGKKRTETVITPVNVLKQVLELDKYVSTLDVHRLDQEGLYNYICNTLSDTVIEKINTFNETDINKAIIFSLLKSSRPLSWKYIKPLSERLIKLNSDEQTLREINTYIHHSRSIDTWEKYKVWLILLIVAMLCLFIYFISR